MELLPELAGTVTRALSTIAQIRVPADRHCCLRPEGVPLKVNWVAVTPVTISAIPSIPATTCASVEGAEDHAGITDLPAIRDPTATSPREDVLRAGREAAGCRGVLRRQHTADVQNDVLRGTVGAGCCEVNQRTTAVVRRERRAGQRGRDLIHEDLCNSAVRGSECHRLGAAETLGRLP